MIKLEVYKKIIKLLGKLIKLKIKTTNEIIKYFFVINKHYY
ncbi:hypothetical protein JIP1600_1430021 [Flavobacterium psychrophilum]|nr:hypothetical protein JIP1600_1430021 [Flavobacterium psychrophilum]